MKKRTSAVGLLMNRLWIRLKEQFGVRPVVLIATLADAFLPLCWLLVSPQLLWFLLPIHLFGAFSAPLSMGPNNLLLKIVPEKNASPYLAVFNAMTGPVTAVGAILGGWFAGAFQGVWEWGPFEFSGLQLLFLISGAGRFLSLGLLYHVVEPQAEPVKRLVRVLHRAQKIRRFRRRPLPFPGAAMRRPSAERHLQSQDV